MIDVNTFGESAVEEAGVGLVSRPLNAEIVHKWSKSYKHLNEVKYGKGHTGVVIFHLDQPTAEIAGFINLNSDRTIQTMWINRKYERAGIKPRLIRDSKAITESYDREAVREAALKTIQPVQELDFVPSTHEEMNRVCEAMFDRKPVTEGLLDSFKTRYSDEELLRANSDYVKLIKKDGVAYWKTQGMGISNKLYNISPEETDSVSRKLMANRVTGILQDALKRVADKNFVKAIKIRKPGRDEIDDWMSSGTQLWIASWNLWKFTPKARTDEHADLYFWSIMQGFLNDCNIHLGNRSFKIEQDGDWDDGVIYLTDRNVEVNESSAAIEGVDEEVLFEDLHPDDKHAVFVIFKRDKKSLLNNLISRFTNSYWSHVAISFDYRLIEMYSFLISTDGFGIENIKNYTPDTMIKVMCAYVSAMSIKQMKERVKEYTETRDETGYRFKNFIACLLKKPVDSVSDPMNMVCSNFVDFMLRVGNLSPVRRDWSTTHPGRLHRALAHSGGEFFTVYKGTVRNYKPDAIKRLIASMKVTQEAVMVNEDEFDTI